jgi:hypothetical protein
MNSSAAFYSTMVGRHKGSAQGKEQRRRREKKGSGENYYDTPFLKKP